MASVLPGLYTWALLLLYHHRAEDGSQFCHLLSILQHLNLNLHVSLAPDCKTQLAAASMSWAIAGTGCRSSAHQSHTASHQSWCSRWSAGWITGNEMSWGDRTDLTNYFVDVVTALWSKIWCIFNEGGGRGAGGCCTWGFLNLGKKGKEDSYKGRIDCSPVGVGSGASMLL